MDLLLAMFLSAEGNIHMYLRRTNSSDYNTIAPRNQLIYRELGFICCGIVLWTMITVLSWRKEAFLSFLFLLFTVVLLSVLVYKVLLLFFWRIEIDNSIVRYTNFCGRTQIYPRLKMRWKVHHPALSRTYYAALFIVNGKERNRVTIFPLDWKRSYLLLGLDYLCEPNFEERIIIKRLRAERKTQEQN